MVKRTKNKHQKKWIGGADVMSFFSNAWNQTKKTSKDVFNNLSQQTQNVFSDKPKPITNSTNIVSTPTTNTNYMPRDSITPTISRSIVGGRKRKNGGRPATVHNLAVAKPTYWIKGGKKGKKTKKRSYKTKKL